MGEIINRIIVGELEENCYILKQNNKAIIIDPGDEPSKIEEKIKGLEVVGVLITHSHFDHVGALDYFENKYNIKHNQDIDFFDYEIIKTPGHSKDSLTFYFPTINIMFTGDFLFKDTIGRMDLAGGSKEDMKISLDKISKYPDNIIIYPGHGEESTLGIEKNNFKYYI